jgi:tRNA pseudouridine13 synthase
MTHTAAEPSPMRAFGASLGTGRMRVAPEDFVVGERLSFPPKGSGPHWLLRVRKRAANTQWVARQLATHARVPPRDVGYAGLKDRHAVTEQWFSVPARPDGGPDWAGFRDPECEIVEQHRHDRKLKPGAARANRFDILVRDCVVDAEALATRVAALRAQGAPNAFGVQRFGRSGDNAARGRAMLRGELHVPDRQERGLLLSAVRSEVFNAVLAARLADGSWCSARPGECLMLEGTHSTFVAAAADADITRRLAELDLHPTGPLIGSGEPRCTGVARDYEESLLAPYAATIALLDAARVECDRRALRIAVRELSVTPEDGGLRFRFELAGGAYATTVIEQFVAVDAAA